MRRLTYPIAALCVLLAPVLVAQSPPAPFRGLIDHVTTTIWGSAATANSEGSGHSISGDGRYVVFSSSESALVADDYNWMDDVFLRDRMAGVTKRISVSESGGDADGISAQAAISTNGRHVVFASGASNLAAGDTNGHWDVHVRDLDANHTVRVSVATDGTQGDADSYSPSISADGRYVVFISSSTTFAPGIQQYGPTQIYLHDRDTDGNSVYDDAGGTATSLVSIGIDMARADQTCVRPRVSANGRYVMFESGATNLDPVGNNGRHHVYLRDRQTEQTRLIDRAVTGGPSAWGINWQVSDMSDDGRFITYSSISPDIVFFDMNWQSQVFLYDAADEPGLATSVVSRTSDGTLGNGSSYYTTVSGDGRFVAFMTAAQNLAGPLANDHYGLVVSDNADGSVTRVDVLDGGFPFDGQYVFNPSLSEDGTAIAFQSDARNAVSTGYPFGIHHIFVATAFSASPASASFPQEGGSGSIDVTTTAVSGWTAESEDDWIVLMDGEGFGAGPRTVQYLVSPNPSGIVRNGRIRLGSTFLAIHQEGDGDTTPPVIIPTVTGTLGPDGWYISDIVVEWSVSDPDSEIVDIGYGCGTATFTSDFIHANPTCEATSHGGSASVSVPLKRDTTAPDISIFTPRTTIYANGEWVMPVFSCADYSGYSGLATCTIVEGSSPLDTTPGWHRFTVAATDVVGNSATKTVEYLAGTGTCVAPPMVPGNLKGWWRFDGNLRDSIMGRDATWYAGPGTFQPGVVNQGWYDTVPDNFLWAWEGSAVVAGQGLTVAAWVLPWGNFGESGTIVSNPIQYRIARYPDGTLRWAFNQTTGFNWVNTGVPIPAGMWSHVAVTYKDGLVQSYLNGRLVHSAQLSGTLTTTGDPLTNLTIGGRSGTVATLFGTLDELMIFDDALPAEVLDSLAQAGSGGLCVPLASNLALTAPSTVTYGSVFQVTALLTDGSGRPLPNRALTITSAITPGYVHNVTTSADGSVTVQFPIDSETTVGDYEDAIVAMFDSDDAFTQATAQADITVVGATPPLTWPPPANITYGTPLGAAQLNATSTFPGTYVYSPGAGTVLDAGTHTLSVTFTPNDTDHYAERTLTTTILVTKATPAIEIASAPLVYNGQPRQAAVTVRGVGGAELSPFTVLYDGGAALPVNADSYALQVNYDGSANYEAVSASGTLVIGKATPIMGTFGDITVTYDGQPHGVSVSVTGVTGESLTPVIVTYNGSTEAPVNAGVYDIEARYEASANYHAVSHAATLTILKAASHLTWPNPDAITYGTPLGAAQLNATANVPGTFAYSPAAGTVLTAGTHTLSATFTPADAANYDGSTASRPLSVTPAPLTIRANDAVKVFGAPLPPFSATATGLVNGDSLASLGGSLVFATPATASSAVGSYAITPSGVSSPNYAIAFVSGTLTIGPASTAVAVFATPNPSGFNQAVTLTATVSVVAPGAGVPAGVVQFFDGGTLLGSTSLSGGTASLTTNGLTAGSHNITASYAGDASFAAGTGAGGFTVNTAAASSTTAVTSSANPSAAGQNVTLTAAVTAPAGLSGSVAFYDGGALIGTATLSGSTAQLTTNALAAGGHAITARYLGNASIPPSTSPAFAQHVEAPGENARTSTTALAASPSPVALGSTVTLTATVSVSPNRVPTGQVLFMVNGSVLGQGTLIPTGSRTAAVSLATAALPRGTHTVEAVYLGDTAFRASRTSIALVVN